MKKINLIGTIALLVLMALGCQPTSPSPVPTRSPIQLETQNLHIRGQIVNIYTSNGKVTGILIQGDKEADTVYAKAIVGIDSNTHIYISSEGNFTDADSSILQKGQVVEVLFSGAIQTSDPVQARALEIVILHSGINRARAGINVPNTQDSREIQEIIHQSYTVFRGALRNGGDITEFQYVFANTSDYSYENDNVRSFVSLVLGTQKANAGGYLTVMQAKYIAYGCAIRLFKETDRLAKKENREVTPEEIKSIQDNCYGVMPPSLGEGAPPILEFKIIEIDGDRATARYDDGAALLEATLIRQNGRWLISNIKPIEIHF